MVITRHPILAYPDDGAGSGPPVGGPPTPPDTGTGAETATNDQAVQENWQDRYKEAQAWGTQGAQWRSENEPLVNLITLAGQGDQQAQTQLAEHLGWQLAGDDGYDDEFADTHQPMDPQVLARLEALEQQRQQTVQAEQEQANYASYRQMTDPQLKELGVPDAYHEVIAEYAMSLPPVHTPQGAQPDLKTAWEQFSGQYLDPYLNLPQVQAKARQQWAATKPTSAVTSTAGTTGTEAVSLDSAQARAAYIAQRIAEAEADN